MQPSATVVLVCVYALGLLVVAWVLDHFGARSAVRAAGWRTGNFLYHEDQDAWKCHQDQWLYPASFDPEKRVIRYQGQHAICGRCPAKSECSPTPGPREVTRAIDPWPHSEAGRFHRGLSLCIAVIAFGMTVAMLLGSRTTGDVVCLLATAAVCLIGGVPLARHLWSTPTNFPEHLPQDEPVAATASPGGAALPLLPVPSVARARADETSRAAAEAQELIDRYATKWSGDARRTPTEAGTPTSTL